jgi:hypothetical protein
LDQSQPVVDFLAPADTQAASLGKPSEGTFNNPSASRKARFTWDRAVFKQGFASFALVFDMSDIALLLHKAMDIIEVIASVSTQMLFGIRARDNNRDNQVICRPFVMDVCTSDKYCQRCAASVDQDMDFTPTLAPVDRALTRCLTTQRGGTSFGIQCLPLPFDMSLPMVELHHLPHDSREHTCTLPSLETLMQCCATHSKPVSVYRFPLATRPQDIPNPVQYRSVVCPFPPDFPCLIDLRYQLPYPSPQWSWYSKIINVLRFCAIIFSQGVSVLMLFSQTLSERDTPSFSSLTLIYG